ncbi:unnamed protein product [Lymnaea stagnalis]|uniref:WAP domain-containing protein n=1 Tax=Lymnaea stagnalis TaxID=6523 RepID=A0AAV2I481_LYMST
MNYFVLPWSMVWLGLHLVMDYSISLPHFAKDVRILCRDTVCQEGTECRVELPCLEPGCWPKPICIEVPEFLDLTCPNTTLAVIVSSKPILESSLAKAESRLSVKYEAFSCYDMNECPQGSVCLLNFCCYD